jgi:hypothetical protein
MSKLEQVILRGTRAAQPAANTLPIGTLYAVTDENLVERSTGAAWELFVDGDAGGGAVDAMDVTYTPLVLADWDTGLDPGDVDQALDQLAERVTDVEAGGGGGAGESWHPFLL